MNQRITAEHLQKQIAKHAYWQMQTKDPERKLKHEKILDKLKIELNHIKNG